MSAYLPNMKVMARLKDLKTILRLHRSSASITESTNPGKGAIVFSHVILIVEVDYLKLVDNYSCT